MKLFGRLLNPVLTFIGIQLAWVLVVGFWLYWFFGRHRELRALAEKYSPELLQGSIDWIILVEGLLLLGLILAGVYVLFVYWKRQSDFYREQKAFISQMSHELRSPLASLKLHLETIGLRHMEPQQLEQFVQIMLEDTSRLEKLINNLLNANRLEQRGLRLTLRTRNLSQLISDFLEKQRPNLPQDVELNLNLTPDLNIRLDQESIEMLLRNLLENAVLHGEGAVRIDVTLTRENNHALLQFSDNGQGIAKPEQKKVFRMFYRSKGQSEPSRGTGLGLFIVRGVVLLHKGKIWLKSAAGEGTTFFIRLPLAPDGDQQRSNNP